MMETATSNALTVEELVFLYETGELALYGDVELHQAVRVLEQADEHFFDDITPDQVSMTELAFLREKRHKLTSVINGILKLLLRRYGCND